MINENTHLSKLTDVYMFISDMVDSIRDDYVSQKARSMGEGVRAVLVDPKLWVNNSVPSEDVIQKMVDEVVKKQSAKVSNYKKWILGYGLVLLCAIFDEFLITLLNEVLEENPVLTKWLNKDEILAKFREQTIKDKYNVFTMKLGFTPTEFFDFTIFRPATVIKINEVNIDDLIKLYKKRNKAAHSDGYVINKIDDLADVRLLFEKLIWNLSLKSRRKWNIKSELIDILVKSEANHRLSR